MLQKSNIVQILYLLIYVTISSIGLLLIKLGSGENRFALGTDGISLFLNTKFILGALLYILSFCLFTFKIITFGSLNAIYPVAVGLGLLVTFLLSVGVLHEAISIKKVIAFFMIVIGCILINLKD